MKTVNERLEKVYREERVAVYHTALTYLKDAAAAEDVMQDVFLTYYAELTRGNTVRHLRAWLLTVTRRRCLNLLRDGGRVDPMGELPTVTAEDPASAVIERHTVRTVLSCLTQEERLAFSLHYLDGYTYREIAEGLDCPTGTVQTRCRIARRKVHAALQNMRREEESV